MSQSVKFRDEAFVRDAAAAAVLNERSMDEQIAHWARIGQAAESVAGFDLDKLAAALTGEIDTAELSDVEGAVWLEAFTAKMASPGPDEADFHEDRAKRQKAG